jgi:hypothetical protein
VTIADVWDNPGGGVAGDSTFMILRALELNLAGVAVSSICDPQAVIISINPSSFSFSFPTALSLVICPEPVLAPCPATANCIIIDHFSAFESGLVAPFLYAACKNGWVRAQTA